MPSAGWCARRASDYAAAVICRWLPALVVAWRVAAAAAAPAVPDRVVLADADPELRHAMDRALAPWQLEVVLAPAAPADVAAAQRVAQEALQRDPFLSQICAPLLAVTEVPAPTARNDK